MNSGTALQNTMRLALGKVRHARLFRNNRGVFWAGKVIAKTGTTVTLEHPRRVECGLVNGSSDLIGFTTIVVTPEMVGTRIAVFTAGECKDGAGRLSDDQKRFIENVVAAGGRAAEIRSVEDALRLVAL